MIAIIVVAAVISHAVAAAPKPTPAVPSDIGALTLTRDADAGYTSLYYVQADVGTPAQRMSLFLDTNSGVLILPGKQLDGKNETSSADDPSVFHPSHSSTATPLFCDDSTLCLCKDSQSDSSSTKNAPSSSPSPSLSPSPPPPLVCVFEQIVSSNVGGTILLKGGMWSDSIRVSQLTMLNATFGIATSAFSDAGSEGGDDGDGGDDDYGDDSGTGQDNDGRPLSDGRDRLHAGSVGVFGLGSTPLLGGRSVFQMLQRNYPGLSNSYSLCVGEYGGVLILGASDSQSRRFYTGDINYIPMLPSTTSWSSVQLVSIGIDGIRVPNIDVWSLSPALLSLTEARLLLPAAAFRRLSDTFQATYCGGGDKPSLSGACGIEESVFFGPCPHLTVDQIAAFPWLSLTLGKSFSFNVPPTTYLRTGVDGSTCLMIALNPSDNTGTIIGSRFLQQYFTVYNHDGGVVGFAASHNCTNAKYRLVAISGDNQRSMVSTKLRDPIVVRVVTLDDVIASVNNTCVFFEVTYMSLAQDESHNVSRSTVCANETGFVSITLFVDSEAGDYEVSAVLDNAIGSPLVFRFVAEPNNLQLVMGVVYVIGLIAVTVAALAWQRAMARRRVPTRPIVSETSSTGTSTSVGTGTGAGTSTSTGTDAETSKYIAPRTSASTYAGTGTVVGAGSGPAAGAGVAPPRSSLLRTESAASVLMSNDVSKMRRKNR